MMRPLRKFFRVMKYLLAGVTVFCVSWMASVNDWHEGVHWVERRGDTGGDVEGLSTIRTIVAYSEEKQAEMDRPSPIACDRLPVFPKILHFNHTWSAHTYRNSWQRVENTPVSLYSAYYDARGPQHYVRILAIFRGWNMSVLEPLFCQTRALKSSEVSIEVVAAKPLEIWYHKWDPTSRTVETPLLLSCPLANVFYGAFIVSVVTEPCGDATNSFVVKPNNDEISKYKRTFTICVKDMFFKKDIVQSLVEWIETNRILGVNLIDVYVDEIGNETRNVLLYYERQGYVRLFYVPIKYNSNRSLWQRRRDHLITYNDCLYRNLVESEYIIPLDVDEVIIPKIAFNWPDLLIRLRAYGWNPNEYSSILVQNVFFFDFMQGTHKYRFTKSNSNNRKMYSKRDDVRIKSAIQSNIDKITLENKYHNSLGTNKITDIDSVSKEDITYQKYDCENAQPFSKLSKHIMRSALVSPVGYYSKSIMVTRRVLTAFNHYPLVNLETGSFVGWSAPFSEVQLNHYKNSCNATVVTECPKYSLRSRVDRTALRLHPRLTHALHSILCQKIKTL